MCCLECTPGTPSPFLRRLERDGFDDLNARLRANASPCTPHERGELAQWAESVGTEIASYTAAIEKLKSRVGLLAHYQKQALSLLSPIRLLPPEILGVIFQFYVDCAGGITFYRRKYKHDIPPNTLGAVCRYWRDVTLSQSTLWTAVNVSLASIQQTTSMDLILTRSSSETLRVPLDITVDTSTDQSDLGTTLILGALASHCERWRGVTLNIPHEYLEHEAFSSVRGRTASLETLSIDWDERWDPEAAPIVPGRWSMFEHAPKLRTLLLFAPANRFVLPWSTVPSLKSVIWGGQNADPGGNLALCGHARELFLQVSWGLSTNGSLGDGIQLSCHTLELDFFELAAEDDRSTYSWFFQSISCPNLQTLRISNSYPLTRYSDHFAPMDPLHKFCSKHSSLRRLSIHDTVLMFHNNQSILTLLDLLPMLESLSISEFKNRSENRFDILHQSVLEGLTTFAGGGTVTALYLPRLKELSLGVADPSEHFSGPAFIRMVESRWIPKLEVEGVACLEKVSLRWSGVETLADPVRVLRAAGLQVTLVKTATVEILNGGEY